MISFNQNYFLKVLLQNIGFQHVNLAGDKIQSRACPEGTRNLDAGSIPIPTKFTFAWNTWKMHEASGILLAAYCRGILFTRHKNGKNILSKLNSTLNISCE